jgi:hypothetical protein
VAGSTHSPAGRTAEYVLRSSRCSFDFRRRYPAPDGVFETIRALFVFRVVSTRVINAAA